MLSFQAVAFGLGRLGWRHFAVQGHHDNFRFRPPRPPMNCQRDGRFSSADDQETNESPIEKGMDDNDAGAGWRERVMRLVKQGNGYGLVWKVE